MNKQEFLSALSDKLSVLSEEDKEKSIEYYSEMIDDRVEDGLSEDEAVTALGSVDEISSRILLDTPLPKLVKAKVKPKRALRVWEIILLVLGSPLWLSLLIAAFAVVLAIYIVIWTLALVLYVVVLSLGVSAIACFIGAFATFCSGHIPEGILCIGAALICAALAILFFCGTFYVVKGLVALSKLILRGIKHCLIGKENAK